MPRLFFKTDPPVIMRSPTADLVVQGRNFTLQCRADGNPPVFYEWFRVNHYLLTYLLTFFDLFHLLCFVNQRHCSDCTHSVGSIKHHFETGVFVTTCHMSNDVTVIKAVSRSFKSLKQLPLHSIVKRPLKFELLCGLFVL